MKLPKRSSSCKLRADDIAGHVSARIKGDGDAGSMAPRSAQRSSGATKYCAA